MTTRSNGVPPMAASLYIPIASLPSRAPRASHPRCSSIPISMSRTRSSSSITSTFKFPSLEGSPSASTTRGANSVDAGR